LTFTSTALSHHCLTHLSKTMPNLTTKLCPAIIHPASCLFSFSGSAKLRSFCLVKSPHIPSRRIWQSYGLLGIRNCPPSHNLSALKDPYASQGRERKGTEFSALSSPPSDSLSSKINQGLLGSAKLRSFSLCQAPLSASLFVRERKGTKILI